MPAFPIIDAHVHLWDPRFLPYTWLRGRNSLRRTYLPADYRRDCGEVAVEAMVFVECAVDEGYHENEVRFIERQVNADPGIQAIVAQAGLEQGRAITAFLERLKATTPLLRGVRRIIEAHADPDFCLRPAFIEGVRALADLELSFEMTANYRHMDVLVRFVEQVPEVSVMLDHCGKPDIAGGRFEPWRSQLRALAGFRNVHCKLSGLTTEADRSSWKESDIVPYVEAAAEAFGFERLVYGSDWPVCSEATTIARWVGMLDRCFAGVGEIGLKRFYRDNAIGFYRLSTAPA